MKNLNKMDLLFTNRALFALFIPLVIEQALSYSVEMIDTMMVSYLGEASVSGISLVSFIITFLISLFSAFSTGGAVITGQAIGAGNTKKTNESANQMVKFVLLISSIIMIFLMVFKEGLLTLLYRKVEPDVRKAALDYYTVILFSIPFVALYNSYAALLRVKGDSKSPMKVMLYMNILNIALNALFIYVLQWGIYGIALATVISRLGSALILRINLSKNDEILCLGNPFRIEIKIPLIVEELKIGIPFGAENSAFYIGKLLLSTLMSGFGTAAITANQVGGSIVMFQILAGTSINLGLTTVISQCIGAKKIGQAQYYTKLIFKAIYISHLVCTLLIALGLPVFGRMFNLSEETYVLLKQYYWIHGISSFTIWPFANSMSVVFRSAGNARFPMIVSTMTMICCRIILAYFFCLYLNMGIMGIWSAMVCDWIIKGFIYGWFYYTKRWIKSSAEVFDE